MKMTLKNPTLTVTYPVHFQRCEKGRLEMRRGPAPTRTAVTGRVPRISRLMALAIRFDDLLRRGEVKDYAELARVGHVTRARVTQIMNLLLLAPDIQEEILFLPPVRSGSDPVMEWEVRPIAAMVGWRQQRRIWMRLVAERACLTPSSARSDNVRLGDNKNGVVKSKLNFLVDFRTHPIDNECGD